MKPWAAAVQTLPERPGLEKRATLPFPVGGRTPADLRRLRDRLFREGKLDLALKAGEEVARIDPGRESFLRLGFLLGETGRYRDALKRLRDALRFHDGAQYLFPEIHLHAASCYLMMGRTKEMRQALRRAYAARWKPRFEPKLHHSFGNALFAHGRYREALQEYARAEAGYRTPLERGRVLVNQALCNYRLGELGHAGRVLDRALRLHERRGQAAELAAARSVRASIYLDLGQLPRALGIMSRVARALRTQGETALEAGRLQDCGYIAGLMGLWSRSRAYLKRAIALSSPEEGRRVLACAHACLATASAHLEDFEEGTRSLKRAEALLRGRRDWVVTLHVCRAHARIAALFGQWDDARRWCRRAECVAKKAGDLPRLVEFRNLRADAEAHLGRRRAALHARKSARRIESMRLGEGPMAEVRRRAAKLAVSPSPILIVGEGTEAVDLAREIHTAGPRPHGPLVVVPCEQITFPASDLAGHTEGAWSGATGSRQGYLQKARGGTLVLDRVDELPPEAQRVLVRMVEGKARPVGGTLEESVDLRVIATCRGPERLIRPLRERLEAAVLTVPALRERSAEIPMIIERILRGRRRITCDAQAALASHSWEGNIPELRGTLERLVALSRDSIGLKLVQGVLRTAESHRVSGRVYGKRASSRIAILMA